MYTTSGTGTRAYRNPKVWWRPERGYDQLGMWCRSRSQKLNPQSATGSQYQIQENPLVICIQRRLRSLILLRISWLRMTTSLDRRSRSGGSVLFVRTSGRQDFRIGEVQDVLCVEIDQNQENPSVICIQRKLRSSILPRMSWLLMTTSLDRGSRYGGSVLSARTSGMHSF